FTGNACYGGGNGQAGPLLYDLQAGINRVHNQIPTGHFHRILYNTAIKAIQGRVPKRRQVLRMVFLNQ
ncbi:MAG TPA: hypothetical protein PLN48_07040, partial [Lachnospiraceae bacterium]|nr:hypothetical protein [Lachnospiraceae bacterium]